MDLVRRGKLGWKLDKMRPLGLEDLGRNESGLALRPVVHAYRGPLQSLPVQVLQVLEFATGEEVGFHRPKTAFFTGFAVGMTDFMTEEPIAVLPGETLHLRHDHRMGPRASQTGQIRVVDNAVWGRVAPKHQRLMQEALHLEAIEGAVEFQVTPFRVAQIKQAGDQPDRLVCQLDPIGRRVVLHLRAWLIRHPVAAYFLRLADTQPAQHARQRRIRYLDLCFFGQLFVYPLDVPVAFIVEPPEKCLVDLLLLPANHRQHTLLCDDCANRATADPQST